MSTKYLPLKKGLTLTYYYKSPSGDAIVEFRVLSVEKKGKVIKAKCQRSFNAVAKTRKDVEYDIVVDPVKGWVDSSAWGKLFPIPPKAGAEWGDEDLRKVESLKATASVNAGEYKDCLLVQRLVAGGDAGGEEHYYAPGIGLVKAWSNSEDDPYEMGLTTPN